MDHICIFSHSYPKYAGDWHANFIESLARAYAQKAQVTVITPYHPARQLAQLESNNLRIKQFRYLPFTQWHILGNGSTMRQDLKIKTSTLLVTPFLLVASLFKLMWLLVNENVSVVHAHWVIPNGIIAIVAKWLTFSRVKVFCSFPGSDVTVLTSSGWMGRICARMIRSQASLVSCNSHDLQEDLVKTGIPEEKVQLIIYGVNEQTMQPNPRLREEQRKRLGFADDDVVCLMVGRFVPKKGFLLGLKAFARAHQSDAKLKLVIVGDGELKPTYSSFIEKNHLAHAVQMPGSLPPQKLKSYYDASDILIMPSQRLPSDGLNVVVPEAMACAKPIIATNLGGNELVVFHGVNGYLHSEKDENSLAEYMIRLANSSQLRAEMGQQSRQLVEQKFNWNAIADQYLNYMDERPTL